MHVDPAFSSIRRWFNTLLLCSNNSSRRRNTGNSFLSDNSLFSLPLLSHPVNRKNVINRRKEKKNIKGKIYPSYPYFLILREHRFVRRTIYISKFNILNFLEFHLPRNIIVVVVARIEYRSVEEKITKRSIVCRRFRGGEEGISERGGKAKTSADCVARSAPWKKERTHLVKTCRYFPLLFLLLAKYTGSGLC